VYSKYVKEQSIFTLFKKHKIYNLKIILHELSTRAPLGISPLTSFFLWFAALLQNRFSLAILISFLDKENKEWRFWKLLFNSQCTVQLLFTILKQKAGEQRLHDNLQTRWRIKKSGWPIVEIPRQKQFYILWCVFI